MANCTPDAETETPRCLTDGHCWHVTSTLTVNPPIIVRQCCWCGQERRDQDFPSGPRDHGTKVLIARTFTGEPFDNGQTDAEWGVPIDREQT